MKKAFFLAVVTTAFALASFAEKGIQPFISPELYGPAFPYNDSYTFDYDGVVFYNECTNELMTLSGSVKVMFQGVYNGDKTRNSIHVNVQGIKAVGESGREYHISGTNNIQSTYSYVDGVYTERAVNNERWTTAGGGNNFTYHVAYSFTIDANGNFTIKRDEFEIHCQ